MDWGGLLSKLGQTWPARMGQGILDAARLPGQVAGGILATRPSQPGMWSDEDEARAQATDRTMKDRATDLAGMVMGGAYGAAPAGSIGVAGAKLGGGQLSPDDAMLAVHNTRADRLAKADSLGGFAVPSVGIVKPSQGFTSFGDVTLVASPDMVKPGRGNPVFASDVYSPRFPSLNDEGTKIFRGFTDMGNRRYAPLTLDNLVREMKGGVRNGESYNYGAGSVRAAVTPQFSSMKDIQSARGRLMPSAQFQSMKDETNKELSELAEKFLPYSKYSGGSFAHMQDFSSMLAEYAKSGLRPMGEHYKDLPPALLDEARAFLAKLRGMPTEYFEAKPQRAVSIGEFKGAVVPESEMAAVAPILERHNLKNIQSYPDRNFEAQKSALMRFPEYFFGLPGLLGGGAASMAIGNEAQAAP